MLSELNFAARGMASRDIPFLLWPNGWRFASIKTDVSACQRYQRRAFGFQNRNGDHIADGGPNLKRGSGSCVANALPRSKMAFWEI